MLKKAFGFAFIAISFLTLVSLGFWQLDRLQWKNNIIAQLETEYAKDPMQHRLEFSDLQNENIRYGHIRGKFDYSKQILVGPKTHEDQIGYDAIIPMNFKNGKSVLVNMGWVKGEKREDIKTPTPRGYIVVTGISRKPDQNKHTPDNSPENNVWTKLDINQIAEVKKISNVAPVIFYAKTVSLTLKEFKMLEDNWFPNNKHRQYAIFWFSAAGILLMLVGFYYFLQRKRNKQPSS